MSRLTRSRLYLDFVAALAALGVVVWIASGGGTSAFSTILPTLSLGALCASLIAGRHNARLSRSLRRINTTLATGHAEPAGRIDERDLPAELLPLVRAYNAMHESREAQRRAAHDQMIDQLHRRAELLQEEVRERTSQLQHSRDLLRIVFDHLPDGLVLLDAQARVLTANDTFSREVLELQPQEVVGRHYRALAEELEQRGRLAFEPRPADPAARRVRRTDLAGQQRWYEIDRYTVRAEGEAQVIERWRDVTRQEELHRQLLLHEQLASLGRLAASVVHEVGNPLQSVRSCLELCREEGPLPPSAAEYLDLAKGELGRMSHILAQLRDLYRPPRQVWEQVDPHQVILTVQRITAAQLRRDRIKLELMPAPELPPVKAQPGALHQVLVNLVLNAASAMPDGGVISIATQADADRHMSRFSVADTGVGMSPRQLSRLFEPFAAGTAQGLGLGLYLSHQIIQQHGGHIDITSTVNVGTTVTVYLPWSEENDDT